ncbi:GyrI-like domain-containing protein [uncultured Enterococcus sp.]|uniref:GyrI-like domain-containing protein n=1 Tax=uncultured Enterococcus sp. TaxID=167972 RepID=UPI002AA79EB8|nr:GyrI-like domain-containing protein [uncultured Enterococcus sp.]
MKHEWRKKEKALYLPKQEPSELVVPKQKFYTISGKGNPNDEAFGEHIAVLYAMSYGIRMMPKNGLTPEGYMEYTVYPLEGIWTLDKEDVRGDGSFSKDDLIYKIMIRQPEFVTEELALMNKEQVSKKKPHPQNVNVQFEELEDGQCVQMLHLGSYDDEPASFEQMDQFCKEKGLTRRTLAHKEIYLTDARKTEKEKMKTVLRYFVE